MNMLLSVFMAAGLGLAIGAIIIFRRGDTKRALLMGLASLVMFGNVAIWITPVADGQSLANSAGD